MRITAFLLTALCVQVSARTVSQTITFSAEKVTLEKIFSVIEQQTDYFVVYSLKDVSQAGAITVKAENQPLEKFLRTLLANKPFQYTIEGNTISVKRKLPGSSNHSERSSLFYTAPPITGRITDAEGQPLSGISVIIKGTETGTSTDANGYFSLNAKAGQVLLISAVAFESTEIKIGKENNLSISLKRTVADLNEVVINKGYYAETKRISTGNVSKVTSKEIEKQPVTNVMGALTGRVPGLEITQTSGTAGAPFTVRIRGQNSIAAGNDPLYIVDGVPFSSDPIGHSYVSQMIPGAVTPLNSLNPSDILSIEVLKDADATAIYGSRGANGVILITTKKGKAGKTKYDIQLSSGFSKVTRFRDLMNTEQYLAMRREAFANDGITEYPEEAYDVNGTWSQDKYVDLQKELIGGTAAMHNIQVSASGGSQQTQFLVKGGYQSETTVLPGDFKYGRGSFLMNLMHRSEDNRFRLSLSNTFTTDDNNVSSNDVSRFVTLPPNVPDFYNEDGSLNWANNTWDNPLAQLEAKYNGRTRNLGANLMLSYLVLKSLELKVSLGYNNYRIDETNVIPSTTYNPTYGLTSSDSYMWQNNANRESWIVEPQLSWNINIGRGKLNILTGGTFQHQNMEQLLQFGYGFSSNKQIYNLAAASQISIETNTIAQYRYQAAFGRINYNWLDKYLINVTARYDGSSRFGPGRQFATFGAVGMAWVFSQEKWLADHLPFISFGKLRGSYGVTGNDQIGDYEFLNSYAPSYRVYQGRGLQAQRLYNQNFGWESNKKLEGGIELGFLKDRIYLQASWYRNRSSNQLVGIPLSAVAGFSSIRANLDALVQNTGWEIEFQTINIQKKKFSWTTSLNFTLPKNKLVAFPGLAGSTYANQYVIGRPLTISKLYNVTGFDPTTGVYQFEDVDRDGVISSPNDRKQILERVVVFYGGFNNSITVGNWQFDIFFQFTKQPSQSLLFSIGIPGTMTNQSVVVQDRWSSTNENALVQPYTTQNQEIFNAFSRANYGNWALEDRSFIRLKNAAVSYRVTQMNIKNLECRFFLQGQNLLTFSKYNLADPEQGTSSFLPPLRTLTAGVQVTF